jgi:hypothetical protein
MLAKQFDREPESINRTIKNIIQNMSENEISQCGIALRNYYCRYVKPGLNTSQNGI